MRCSANPINPRRVPKALFFNVQKLTPSQRLLFLGARPLSLCDVSIEIVSGAHQMYLKELYRTHTALTMHSSIHFFERGCKSTMAVLRSIRHRIRARNRSRNSCDCRGSHTGQRYCFEQPINTKYPTTAHDGIIHHRSSGWLYHDAAVHSSKGGVSPKSTATIWSVS